jgi:hypothetical protein
MVVNSRTYKINKNTHKLTRTSTLLLIIIIIIGCNIDLMWAVDMKKKKKKLENK